MIFWLWLDTVCLLGAIVWLFIITDRLESRVNEQQRQLNELITERSSSRDHG